MAPKAIRKSSNTDQVQLQVPPKCYLDRLPLEILAEVLLNTASPRDILAVARCSKFLCVTLVNNPATVYIWKLLRQKFHSIPDPTPNWTESSYAVFLFDDSNCEVCKKRLNGFPCSFALRLRLCGANLSLVGSKCGDVWMHEHTVQLSVATVDSRYLPLTSWLPHIESLLSSSITTLPIVRGSDWLNLRDAFNKATLEGTVDAFLAEGAPSAQRAAAVHFHSNNLIKWRRQREAETQLLQKFNDTFAKDTAKREGWRYSDMITSPTFSALFRCKTVSQEQMTVSDIEFIRPALERDIIDGNGTRGCQKREKDYAKALSAVKKRYRALNAGGGAVPPLADFKQLHSMQMVLKQPTAVKMLTNNQLNQPLTQAVENWVHNARNALGEVLGFPDWKSASMSKVHIAERVNARFLCSKCQKSGGVSRWDDPGLSFQDACKHTCPHLKKKKRDKMVWNTNNFVADIHGIGTINQVLSEASIDAEQADAADKLSELDGRIVCRACPVPLVMNFHTMVRHSRRHEAVKFEVVSREAADNILNGAPFTQGLNERLRNGLGDLKILRDKRMFACRHCALPIEYSAIEPSSDPENVAPSETLPSETADSAMGDEATGELQKEVTTGAGAASESSTSVASSSTAPQDAATGTAQTPSQAETPAKTEKALLRQKRREKEKARATYTFNGMRSHVKAKHGIAWIGDEDFYQVPE